MSPDGSARVTLAGGCGLLVLGAYLLLARVATTTGLRSFLGGRVFFGIALGLLFAGVALLVARAGNRVGLIAGRALAGLGGAAILGAVLADLPVYLRAVSLPGTVKALLCLAAGFGLVLRATRGPA